MIGILVFFISCWLPAMRYVPFEIFVLDINLFSGPVLVMHDYREMTSISCIVGLITKEILAKSSNIRISIVINLLMYVVQTGYSIEPIHSTLHSKFRPTGFNTGMHDALSCSHCLIRVNLVVESN